MLKARLGEEVDATDLKATEELLLDMLGEAAGERMLGAGGLRAAAQAERLFEGTKAPRCSSSWAWIVVVRQALAFLCTSRAVCPPPQAAALPSPAVCLLVPTAPSPFLATPSPFDAAVD